MSPRRAAALRDSGGERSLREHLIATDERMISERGTVGLTVRGIAREARVADGVLYNHLADKDELLAHALGAHARTIERGLSDLPEPGVGTVEAGLRAHIAHGLALHRAILPALAGLIAQPKILARFADLAEPGENLNERLIAYLRAERDLGRLAPDAQVDAAAAMIVGVCHETVLSQLFDGAPISPQMPASQEAVDDLVTAVLDGIGR
jgi:AcrR family transcriptional regulator